MTFAAEDLVALPRPGGLSLSPDGRRLVAGIAQLTADGAGYRTTLWELDPTDLPGPGAPRAAVPGGFADSAPVFAFDGSLLHLSDRPHPDGAPGATLWRQRPGGGDPEPVLTVPGGILTFSAASAAPVVLVKALLHPESADLAADALVEPGTARVFDDYPVRWWDSWLGPRTPRLLRVDLDTLAVEVLTGGDRTWWDPYGHGTALTPDGRTAVSNRRRTRSGGQVAYDLVAVDTAGVRVLADDGDYLGPAVSPDGRFVVAVRRDLGAPDRVEQWTVMRVDLSTGERVDLLPDWPLWPLFPTWTRDGSTVLFFADENGRQPLFEVDAEGGTPRRVLADAGYDSLVAGAREADVYAVRGSVVEPPSVVHVDRATATVRLLPFVAPPPPLPGVLHEVHTTVRDGAVVKSWLVLPPGCSATNPAPLATWLHGGPAGTWSRWDWRWNPHVFAAAGWALLLPDVAQSAGYGPLFQGRGRGDWQGAPVTDVLDVVAHVGARPDIDPGRLVAGGGSFGGYLANALAVRENPFSALVSACGIWSLDQHRGTSDSGNWSEREFGSGQQWRAGLWASSPEAHADRLGTPMLVIHGEQDMRVPLDQALRLWTDLRLRDVESRLLVFSDEGHHIPSRPRNVVRAYQEIFSFFERHSAPLPHSP